MSTGATRFQVVAPQDTLTSLHTETFRPFHCRYRKKKKKVEVEDAEFSDLSSGFGLAAGVTTGRNSKAGREASKGKRK